MWRHRILASLQNQQSKIVLDGIVESGGIFYPFRKKGREMLIESPESGEIECLTLKKEGFLMKNYRYFT